MFEEVGVRWLVWLGCWRVNSGGWGNFCLGDDQLEAVKNYGVCGCTRFWVCGCRGRVFFFGWLCFLDFSGASTGATAGRTGCGVVGLLPQGHEGW